MNTIENLYYGNVSLEDRTLSQYYKSAIGKLAKYENKLTDELPPEFLDLFNKYSEIYSDLANSEYRDMFCIGFRLGVKIMVDVYTVDDGVVSDPHID